MSADSSYFFLLDTESKYVAQAGFELVILLFQSPQLWDDRHVPSCSTLTFSSHPCHWLTGQTIN
jgi:hypothetical protein